MLSLNQVKVPLTLFVFALFCSGCASPESQWKKAQAMNTVPAFEEFLADYGNSEYAAEAKSRIRKLQCEKLWSEVQRLNNVASFKVFMEKCPDSEYTSQARNKIDQLMEDLRWSKAKKTDTTEVYHDFMTSYPKSSHIQEAQQLVASARKREEFLDTLANLKDIAKIQHILLSDEAQKYITPKTIPQLEELLSSKSNTSKADIIPALKATPKGRKGRVTISSPFGLLGVGPYKEARSTINMMKGQKMGEMKGEVFINVGGKRLTMKTEFSSDSIPSRPGRRVIGNLYDRIPVIPLADGSIHRFNGSVELNGFAFFSKDDPLNRLTFLLTDKGYVYLRGKGSIRGTTGGRLLFLNFPPSK